MTKSEDMSSTEIIDSFVNELMGILPFVKIVHDFFIKIINVIPNALSAINTLSRLYIFNGIELILLIISITIINQYSPDKILIPESPEGTIFIVFLIFLFFNVLHTCYLYLYKTDLTGYAKAVKDLVHTFPTMVIVFVFSFIIWILMNLLGWIQLLFSTILDTITLAIKVLTDMLRNPEDAITVYKYGALYSILLIILVFAYLAVFNPSLIPKDTTSILIGIIIPLILGIVVAVPLIKGTGKSAQILFLGVFILFFVALAYFYSKGDTKTNGIINYITLFVTIIMVIGGLSIAFYTLSNYLKTFTGWAGFFIYLIFYIPCLFIDLVRYILNEFKMTSSTIYILLIFEVLVILLYFYLPLIMEKLNPTKKVVLLAKGAFLDISQTIGSSEMNKAPPVGPIDLASDMTKQNVYNRNYAFSFWIYLNPQPPNNIGYATESQIFNFGDGKPRIVYFNDVAPSGNNDYGHSAVDKYKIYFTNSSAPKGFYEFSLPGQKWNNITVNFTPSQADLFINGKLEFTYIFRGNLPSYAPTDYVTIGQNQGVDGAISNIVYYPQNISLIEITNHYNMLMYKNPPY